MNPSDIIILKFFKLRMARRNDLAGADFTAFKNKLLN